jgi:hypothetical protein
MKQITYILSIMLLMLGTSISYSQQTENRPLQSFNGIKTGGLVQVHLQEGDKEGMRLEVKGVGLKDIITSVDNGVLIVKTEENHNGEDIQVYVTYKQLNNIAVGGASKVYAKSVVKAKELNVSTSAGGDAFLAVDVDLLHITMEGAGNMIITGRANTQKIDTTNLEQGTLDRTGLVKSK